MSILSKKKISFDEKDAPLDGATHVGETVFQGKEVSLYSKQDKFFLWSRKWQRVSANINIITYDRLIKLKLVRCIKWKDVASIVTIYLHNFLLEKEK